MSWYPAATSHYSDGPTKSYCILSLRSNKTAVTVIFKNSTLPQTHSTNILEDGQRPILTKIWTHSLNNKDNMGGGT